MNWEKNLRITALAVLFGLGLVNEANSKGNQASIAECRKHTIITEANSNELLATSKDNLFKIDAFYDGEINLCSKESLKESVIVTVFTADYNDILAQSGTLICEEGKLGLSFNSEAGRTYYIMWDLGNTSKDVCWRVNQKELEGISPKNAISAQEGILNATHSDENDQWFVFEPSKSGKVCFSSLGHTSENTCLFVYNKQLDLSLGSSNGVGGVLQSQVVLDCKKNEKYYLKWSSAFTNGSYAWSITYCE